MAEAARSLRQDAAPRRVHVAALPALAQLWLAPRLPELRARLPGLEISVTALETPPNLKRIPFDLCLFYTAQLPATGVVLAQDHLLPVCTPELARQIATPLDLRRMVCLTDTSWADDWAIWAATAMPDVDFAPRGPVFSLYAVALQEALSGAGVLIARRSLVARHLATGRLVAPIAVTAALLYALIRWGAYRPLRSATEEQVVFAARAESMFIEIRPAGIDLLSGRDVAWLEHAISATAPDLLVLGPLYKLHHTNPSDETSARELVWVLDGLRERYGFALLTEAHAGNASDVNGDRLMRPIGSSLFRRWPEFGFGLRKSPTQGAPEVDVVSWRGSREERDWPEQLVRAETLPWMPVGGAYGALGVVS